VTDVPAFLIEAVQQIEENIIRLGFLRYPKRVDARFSRGAARYSAGQRRAARKSCS
jgi:hypothetical protein